MYSRDRACEEADDVWYTPSSPASAM